MRLSIALVALLAGCGAAPVRQQTFQPPPADLMALCPAELPTASDGMSSTILSLMVEWAELYHQCAARHAALVDAINAESVNGN